GTPVNLDGLGGLSNSLKIVNGKPAISYLGYYGSGLKYVIATDVSGTSWGAPITIDAAGSASTSLEIVNGNPAISYAVYTHPYGRLKYVRANDANGSAWGTPVVFDATGSAGEYTSLQIVNGNPAFSYYDLGNPFGNIPQDLKYVRATNASGTAWGTPITIDAEGGENTSLQIVNGNPAVSYYTGDLKYVRATDVSGTLWDTPVTVDNKGNAGDYTSLRVVNGNPAISYYEYNYPNSYLKYIRATNESGTAWGTPVIIDSTGNVGQYTSLQIVNGNPAISYFEDKYPKGYLKYVRATNASGTAWGTPVILDSAGTVGQYSSLQIVNGNPAISYFDATNGNLKYIWATNVSGTAWSAPINIDSGGRVGGYTSLQVVNGNPAISYFDYNDGLKYVRANDASGFAWGNSLTLAAGINGAYNSMISTTNGVGIAFYNGSESLPYYISGVSTSCQNNHWVGNISSAWENPLNWSCGSLPNINADVIINAGSVVVIHSNVSINSLTLSTGVNFTIDTGFKLNVRH
ncbi:MAG: hypothetical protein ABIN97_03820, partial [Ginsengibacter sp.]